MEEFKTPTRYEAFVRAGAKEPYREAWHASIGIGVRSSNRFC